MLTDEDMLLVEGKHDELMGRLQTKLGKSTEQHKKLSLIFLPYYYWQ